MDEKIFFMQIKELLKEINIKFMSNLVKMYEPYDLTPPQAAIITILYHNELLKVSELSSMMRTPDSNVSSICRRLEDRGFIERIRDKDDRRVVYIKATNKTKELYEQIECENKKLYTVADHLSEEDKMNIIKALKQLSGLINKE